MKHDRKSYMFFGLLGDLGGVMQLIMLGFGLIMYPISEHQFTMKASRFLFFARTSMQNLFLKSKEDSRIKRFRESGLLTHKEATELEKHHKIQLPKKENVLLFLHVWLGKSFLKKCCTFKNSEILSKLYYKTTDNLEQDLNIVRLIKRLRDVKILAN